MDCLQICLALQEVSLDIHQISTFVLHRSECHRLARSYDLVVRHVTAQVQRALNLGIDPASAESLLPSFSELHHVMLQGRKFLQDSSLQVGWVKNALLLAFSTDAQDSCLHDLVWCLCVVHEALRQLSLAVLDSEDDVFRLLNQIWDEKPQMDDLMTLNNALAREMAELEHQVSCTTTLTDVQEKLRAQLCLARFLFQKVQSEMDISAVNEPQRRPQGTLPECMWVDPHEFIIKEAIGHGAFSVVYEAKWNGEIFGQKEFFGVDESVFEREAVIQSRLRHPNLLQLICCTSKPSRNKCSMVTELMEMDLRRTIDNRCKSGFDPPFPVLTAVDVMLQISKGMEYLHGLHIMHRDLKSPNVLVNNHVYTNTTQDSGRIRVKIADFGMSKAKHLSSNFTSLQVGTTYWRAPEVFKVDTERELEAKYTRKADVYSFAMVCYEILSGKVPFEDGGKLKDLHKRLARGERPILPAHCPQYLVSYIERCWHSNPEKRPCFAQISRTMRHLKGILLRGVGPLFPSLLSYRSCTNIEDKLQQTIGPEWVSRVSRGLTTPAMTIRFEMSWYKVMETKLRTTVVPDINSSRSLSSKTRCWYWLTFGRRRRKEAYPVDVLRQEKVDQIVANKTLRQFTFEDLNRASDHFSHCVGIGGGGHIYKATLSDGQVVAVKAFSQETGEESEQSILRELELLGRISHPNLVPLLGFCNERGRLMLVYKFMSGGDLEKLRQSGVRLSWSQKYTILCGVASALNYLHNKCPWQVLHRDVKPSNILLDQNLEPCLADFGITRLLLSDETHVTTVVRGTMGYMAPEYVATLKLGPEADVYSFGVVVLELACERRYIERDAENVHIIRHVWAMYKQKRLLDAVKEGRDHCDTEELQRLLQLGLACTLSNPKHRPDMQRVVDILSKKVKAPTPVYPRRDM